MSFTETTTTSWFSRLKSALIGALIGLIVVVAAIGVLFWNEGRSIKAYRALAEGAGLVVSVNVDTIDPENDGKLVHVSGVVTPDGIPSDEEFGIAADGAVALNRDVEMYQWVESSESTSETKLGGSEETVTTYKYNREWRPGYADSSEFRQPEGHENPEPMVASDGFAIDSAMVGAFAVPGNEVVGLGSVSAVKLTAADAERVSEALGLAVGLDKDGFYAGANPAKPEVGDLRIRFTRADVVEASFVAAQSGDWLAAYTASNGREIFLGAAGKESASDMFATAQSENTMITWLVRLGGLIGLLIGFSLVFSIFGVLADVVPFIGSIVRFGTGFIAVILTALIGPLVIAIGWFAYRPVLALGILIGGGLIAAAVIRLRRRSAPQPAVAG